MTVALILVALGTGGAAHAGDAAEAEALIRKGIELRQQGRDATALPLFQKAYDLVATPRTAGQLGCGEMALGYWVDADQHLGEALAATDDAWVARNLTTLKDAYARVKNNIGEVVVSGIPAGAKVAVNRRSVGVLPLMKPVRVAKGRVEIEVSAPGFVARTESLQVGGGEHLHFAADLVRAAPESAATGQPTRAPPVASAEAAAAPPVPQTPSPRPSSDGDRVEGASSPGRKIGWGLGIAAGAALVGGIVETALWQRRRGQFNSTTGCYEDAPDRGAPGCSSTLDSAHRAEVGAIVGYAATAALAGGAAALLLTSGSAEPRATKVACAPAIGLGWINCRFSF
jgi:hypothetical protein